VCAGVFVCVSVGLCVSVFERALMCVIVRVSALCACVRVFVSMCESVTVSVAGTVC